MTTFRAENARVGALVVAQQRAALVAQEIRNDAVRACPVLTGRLRQSITVQKIGDGNYRVGTNVSYSIFVEMGTRFQAPNPFLRPALEKARRRG